MSWLRRAFGGSRWDGASGVPRSANGASSFHLVWDAPPGDWIRAEVVLEVVEPPRVPALYFWALQVSFAEGGRAGGGGHLGLQWYPPHPGSTAVNWGGYGPDGRELGGSGSVLPSATANPNTRDLAWRVGQPYRLAVERGADRPDGARAWRGSVTDLSTGRATVVRELYAAGSRLVSPMVWSEVFADCDAPGAAVRWSELAVEDERGRRSVVEAVTVNYQPVRDGGCVTTDSAALDAAFVQRTGTTRRTPQGARLVQQSRS